MEKTQSNHNLTTHGSAIENSLLQKIYADNYYKTESFIKNNSGSADEAKDIYQEAFLVLWKRLRTGEMNIQNQEHINAFLYRVARNKWIDQLRSKEHNAKSYLDGKDYENNEYDDKEKDEEWEKKLKHVIAFIRKLKPDCRKLLTGFYFNRMSIKAIAKEFNIDEASAKNKKYRCMEKLRSMAFENL